jgi:hypothetical protein
MLPSEVTNVKIQDASKFDKYGNPMNVVRYTFFIGEHGPFMEEFGAGEQDAPAVERRINERVENLRALGVLAQK